MKTAKITRKGQITIPVEFRKKLGTDLVEIEMQEEKVIIKPVKKIGGIFHRYALKDKPIEEILKMEKEAVNNAFREKHSNR
ncbi:AbrB/MazE/SpoVT family DNA-binding domain-containing protein [Thermatribacter velox]|uniref:AbrB/MazE/SpoVT family DNA-binding domain-containing protein n=1 Tax=Thermatribacter velox TaxID=3039681 RepID=A0ABZ2YAE8_9BACT